jgi:hypothetical protein
MPQIEPTDTRFEEIIDVAILNLKIFIQGNLDIIVNHLQQFSEHKVMKNWTKKPIAINQTPIFALLLCIKASGIFLPSIIWCAPWGLLITANAKNNDPVKDNIIGTNLMRTSVLIA